MPPASARPERLHRSGSRSGGAAFSRGKLYALLANPLFIGRIRHRDQVHPGQHPPIVEAALWQAVQEQLAANRRSRTRAAHGTRPEPAGRSALRSRGPEDAAEPCQPQGPALSLLCQRRSRRRRRRRGRHRLADPRARDRGRRRQGGGRAAAGSGAAKRGAPLQPVRLRGVGAGSLRAWRSWRTGSRRRHRQPVGRRSRLLIARVELSRSELRATASFERLKETRDAAVHRPCPLRRSRRSWWSRRCGCSVADRNCASCSRARPRRRRSRTRCWCGG